MSPRQRDLLDFIRDYQAEHGGASPSFEDMSEAMAIKSSSNIHRILTSLERKGQIRRTPRARRAIEIVGIPFTGCLTDAPTAAIIAELRRRGIEARAA